MHLLDRQVRCMVSVLTMIGRGHAPTTFAKDLLDIERTPRRPSYAMAPGVASETLYAHGVADGHRVILYVYAYIYIYI